MTATLSETLRLIGREAELETLLGLVDRMSERGGALVIHGEPGIGKTALLDTLWDRASACVTARAARSSPRWSSPSQGCTNYVRRFSIDSNVSPSATDLGETDHDAR
jgi:Cdc6-like AAA superfamily ATPase